MVFDLVWKGKKHTLKEVPIKTKEIEFDKNEVDSKNVPLKKIRNPKYSGEKANIFVYEDGSLATEHFKAINGVAKSGFSKTECVDESRVSVMPVSILKDVVSNDHTYYLVGEDFKRVMVEIGEESCMVFKPYTIRGFKAYRSIVFYHKPLDRVIMKLCRSDIKDAEMPETGKAKEVSVVEKVDENDIVC